MLVLNFQKESSDLTWLRQIYLEFTFRYWNLKIQRQLYIVVFEVLEIFYSAKKIQDWKRLINHTHLLGAVVRNKNQEQNNIVAYRRR